MISQYSRNDVKPKIMISINITLHPDVILPTYVTRQKVSILVTFGKEEQKFQKGFPWVVVCDKTKIRNFFIKDKLKALPRISTWITQEDQVELTKKS